MSALKTALETNLKTHLVERGTPLYVAFSGGCDSTVLLHAIKNMLPHINAIHVNHGLHADANDWEAHCQKICDAWQIPLTTLTIQVDASANIEANARQARYEAINNTIPQHSLLLTAHHADDLMETMLLHLIRGAGVKGLSGIPLKNTVYGCNVLRPLLALSRKAIETYAKEFDLTWIEDPANESQHFDRNYLRKSVLPLLKERFPSMHQTWYRTAQHCEHASQLETLHYNALIENCRGQRDNTLSVTALTSHSQHAHGILRHWLQTFDTYPPSVSLLDEITQHVIGASLDADPKVVWGQWQIRRYQDALFCIPYPLPDTSAFLTEWDGKIALELPFALGRIDAASLPELNTHTPPFTVRFRQGGERYKPPGRVGSHPLKKLFQEWGIPTWERDRIPLIFKKDVLICVVLEQSF